MNSGGVRITAFSDPERKRAPAEMDREELISYIEYLEIKAGVDALTGAANRGTFDEKLAHSLVNLRDGHAEKRKNGDGYGRVGLVMIDLDHFKEVNDAFGHQAGDDVLRAVAALLMRSVRDTDLVARYGGEEFAILMRGADESAASRKSEELRGKVAELAFDKHPGVAITASFGVASSKHGDTPDDLVSRADQALYRAKNSGRDSVITYTNL